MTLTIGDTTFDNVRYDVGGDVLHLHVGDPRQAVDFDESPEGHALRLDADRNLVGLTIVNAKWLLERDGRIAITFTERVEVGLDSLSQALVAA